MRILGRVGRWLVTHKRGEEEAEVAVSVSFLAVRMGLALGLGASVASAAILAPGLVDVSNNNGAHAAVAISAPGVQAVEAKATEGLRFRDSVYPAFRAAAARHHRAFGGYLFLHPDLSGAAQAAYFLAYARPHRGDIEPVVDSETGPPARAAPATYAALRALELRGYRPILYASSSYLAGLVAADPRLKRFPVWQAEYGPRLHLIPGVRVIAWQFTDRAHVGGIAVDGSHLLVRNLATLEIRPAKKAKPKPPPVRLGRCSGIEWPHRPAAVYRQATHCKRSTR